LADIWVSPIYWYWPKQPIENQPQWV